MMLPNHWDPFSKTLISSLHPFPSSFLVSLSQHSQSLAVRVHATHALSPQQQNPITAQVSRMLRFSKAKEKAVREFRSLHMVDHPNKSFSRRVFHSLTLFEDMVKCILLYNFQWSRTLSMAQALCELQLELTLVCNKWKEKIGESYRNIIWREKFQFQKCYKIYVMCVTVKVNITNKMDTQSEMRHSKFKRICGFYGSSPDKKSTYQDAAIELGNELVSRNIDLVYGGGSIGLMGLVSQDVHDGGHHVIGVIPKTLMPRERLKLLLLLRCCLAPTILLSLELVIRLIVILQDKAYIYEINSLIILDIIETVPNIKGLCAFFPCLDACYLALPASTTKGSALLYNIMECHLHCESYSFRRGTYLSTIFSLSFGQSKRLLDILAASSSSGHIHLFTLGFASHPRSKRSSGFLGSIIPDDVYDMLDLAYHHVLHNLVPTGVKR